MKINYNNFINTGSISNSITTNTKNCVPKKSTAIQFGSEKILSKIPIHNVSVKQVPIHKNKIYLEESPINKYFLDLDTFLISGLYKCDATNYSWAEEMNKLTYKASSLISKDKPFECLMEAIANGISAIYNRRDFGRLINSKKPFLIQNNSRGKEYLDIYYDRLRLKSESVYTGFSPIANFKMRKANVCHISKNAHSAGIQIAFPQRRLKTNLELVKNEYENLKSSNNPSVDEINKSNAIIHWLIAQESPYERGSNSIANVLTKSIYHYYGIKTGPARYGCSFDFEAFYRDLNEFIKIYPYLFRNPPKKVL